MKHSEVWLLKCYIYSCSNAVKKRRKFNVIIATGLIFQKPMIFHWWLLITKMEKLVIWIWSFVPLVTTRFYYIIITYPRRHLSWRNSVRYLRPQKGIEPVWEKAPPQLAEVSWAKPRRGPPSTCTWCCCDTRGGSNTCYRRSQLDHLQYRWKLD